MKQNQAKWLELVFENTESVRIDIDDVEDFAAFGIHEKREHTSDGDHPAAAKTRHCDRLLLRINQKANVFDEKLQKGMKVFDRIAKYEDIVYLEYLDEKGECLDRINVPWDGPGENNQNQVSHVDQARNGSLVIEIEPIATDKQFKNKMKRQRAEQGFCDEDLWDMSYWFFRTAGKMIRIIADKVHTIPYFTYELYYKKHKEELGNIGFKKFMDGISDSNHPYIGAKESGKADRWCFAYWKRALKKLADLFRDSLEETCSMKNPYEEEFRKAAEEKKDKAAEYSMAELPEYKEIWWKHFAAQMAIERKLESNRKKALRLFAQYLRDLDV